MGAMAVSPQPVYKITRPDRTTFNGFRWDLGQWYDFPGAGDLCGPGWAHFYPSPQLAVLLNPIHANYWPFALWRGEGHIGSRDLDLKVGCSRSRIVEAILVPEISPEAGVTSAIHCVLAVSRDHVLHQWAYRWLAGIDRTSRAAEGAAARAMSMWGAAARAAAAASRVQNETARAMVALAMAAAARVAATRVAAAAENIRPLDLIKIAHAALLPWNPTRV